MALGSVSSDETANSLRAAVESEQLTKIIASTVKPPRPDSTFTQRGLAVTAAARNSISSGIPSEPTRTLDLPGVQDDFYISIMDWSVAGFVAVALGPTLYLWDANTGVSREIISLVETGNTVTAVRFAPDPRFLAVGTSLGQAWIIDVSQEQPRFMRDLTGVHQGRILTFDWTGPLLASGAEDGIISLWDVRQRQSFVTRFAAHDSATITIRWSPDGSWLASGGADNTISLWRHSDIDTAVASNSLLEPRRLFGHTSAVRALAWSHQNPNLLATGGGQGDAQLIIWDVTSGGRVAQIRTPCQITDVLWSRHENELVTSHGFYDNNLAVWSFDNQRLQRIADLRAHRSRVLGLAMSPDGRLVCSVGADENICFWNIFNRRNNRRQLQQPQGKAVPGAVPRGIGDFR